MIVESEMSFDKFDSNKKRLLEGLRRYRGIVTSACKFANLDRQTFYNYKKDDPAFAQAVEDVEEEAIDFVEGKLYEKINGVECVSYNGKGEATVYDQPPSDTAIIFYLKTKGKKRGYVERQEITGKDGDPIESEITVKVIHAGPRPVSHEKDVDA
ncbi:hypothetical protein [Pedobacter sp. SYSU D00535]|uniref:hypothetical protein n=1 Tax=Pedobacter sp. SYSU D00535 TaxID=2810308 RepID=UPI001A95D8A7|nr:hypothetical protein [Pedobacter sp. SYSU D00535]